LLAIREEMAREADYDADLFLEMVRSGRWSEAGPGHEMTDSLSKKTAGRKSKSKESKR